MTLNSCQKVDENWNLNFRVKMYMIFLSFLVFIPFFLACFQLMDMWRVLERRWVGSLWFALHWETPLKCFQLFWEVCGWHLTRSIVDFLKRKLKKLLPGPGDVGGFENESKMCKASALPNCSCARANFPDCELNISNVFVFRCTLASAKFWECLLAVVFLIFLVNRLNLHKQGQARLCGENA